MAFFGQKLRSYEGSDSGTIFCKSYFLLQPSLDVSDFSKLVLVLSLALRKGITVDLSGAPWTKATQQNWQGCCLVQRPFPQPWLRLQQT